MKILVIDSNLKRGEDFTIQLRRKLKNHNVYYSDRDTKEDYDYIVWIAVDNRDKLPKKYDALVATDKPDYWTTFLARIITELAKEK